jgi:hypothetical protein
MTEQRVREIIREELAAGCPPWADEERRINRNLRGWVLVTDGNGEHQTVRWATEDGLRLWKKTTLSAKTWDQVEDIGWTVEPFDQMYTEEVLQRALRDTGASASTVGNLIYRLRRLRDEA